MTSKLHNVLRYFTQFGYKPSFEEIYTFFPTKISESRLKSYLNKTHRYTLGGYRKKFEILPAGRQGRNSKLENSLTKIRRVRGYLDFVSKFPQIRLIGLSGSVAMLNAKKNDDVDLFIISADNRIWTARFVTVITAWLCGLKRSRKTKDASNKVCLNLFFSESSLKIDKKSQSAYMAHEVLQMMPIMDVNETYRRFLYENDWIAVIFPNVDLKRYLPHHASLISRRSKIGNSFSLGAIGNVLELFFKTLQMAYMSESQGDERIEQGQLWFHPRDYSRIVGN